MALSNKKSTPAKQEETVNYDVKVTRAKKFDNGGITYDLNVNGVMIYGCTYHEYQGKGFTSFPARKGSDGKYYSHAYFKISDDLQAEIEAQVDKMIG